MKKIFTFLLCQILLSGLTLSAQCNFGHFPPTYTTSNVSFGNNYMGGSKRTFASTGTLTGLGLMGQNSGGTVRMALYSDGTAGQPGTLIAYTGTAIVGGNMVLPVLTPTVLPPGDYWIMATYLGSTNGGLQVAHSPAVSTSAAYYAITPSATPVFAPTWSVFPEVDFGYWADLNPIVEITGPSTGCKGQTLNLTVTGATDYTWTTLSTNTVITINPTVTTTYSATGTWTNGCYSVATKTITILLSPTITVNSGTICAGNTFTLQAGGATSYTFSSVTNTVSPQQTTNYTVSGTSSGGCVGSGVSTVVVNVPPLLTINSGSVCSGSNYTLVPGGAVNYTIEGGSTVVSPASNATYSITGADAIGCKSTITATVSVLALPSLSLSSSNSSICVGEEGILTVNGASSYSWSTNATNSSISVNPATTSTYTVKGTDANGCSTTAMIVQYVNLCAGLENNGSKVRSIKFYPNPTKGVIIIDAIAFSATSQVEIYNAMGQKIFSDSIHQESFSVDLKNFPNGVYTFQITETPDSVQHFKVIKN